MCYILEIIFNFFSKVNYTKNTKIKIYPKVNSSLHEYLDNGEFINIKL